MSGAGWLDALAEEARRAMPEPMATYVEAGSREELTVREATAAWSTYRLLPRVLRDVSAVSTATAVLGCPLATPVAVAPTSMLRGAHPEGEGAMARGAAAAGALHVVSSNAGIRFAELRAEGPWWLQLYVPPEREAILPLVHAAVDGGAAAIVLTADTPVPGTKYAVSDRDWAGIDLSWHRVNLPAELSTTWANNLTPADIRWLRATVDVPVVVKGVLRPDDARACVEAGAAAIYVSTHGGRQLDRVLSSAHALPEVAAAVGDDVEVYVDGGVRSGLDVFTAHALGADAVFVGRPALWGLAAGGADGVTTVLRTLTDELAEAMALAGAPSLAEARGLAVPAPLPPAG